MVKNLCLLLSYGFILIFEVVLVKLMLGVIVWNVIDEGLIDGLCMMVGSFEVIMIVGLGDECKCYIYQESFGFVVDGFDEMCCVVCECVCDGVDIMKINIFGDEFVSYVWVEIILMEDEEFVVFVKVVYIFGKMVVVYVCLL